MAGLNKVMLIGNLGRDPEIRYSQQGTAVVNFPLATSEQWTDKNTGEKQERTEWHNVVAFGKQAEILEKYLSKGRPVFVEGRMQTQTYEKEGQTHYITKVVVNNFQFLGGRSDNQGGGNFQQGPGQSGGGYGGGGYSQGGQPGGNYGGGGYSQGGRQGGAYPQGNGYSPQGGAAPANQNFQDQTTPGMTGGGQPPAPEGDDDIPF